MHTVYTYVHVFLLWGKAVLVNVTCTLQSVWTLTGRTRSMRRKAGDNSPKRQESSHDSEASGRAGSKKRESCAYMYIVKSKIDIYMVFLIWHKELY